MEPKLRYYRAYFADAHGCGWTFAHRNDTKPDAAAHSVHCANEFYRTTGIALRMTDLRYIGSGKQNEPREDFGKFHEIRK